MPNMKNQKWFCSLKKIFFFVIIVKTNNINAAIKNRYETESIGSTIPNWNLIMYQVGLQQIMTIKNKKKL